MPISGQLVYLQIPRRQFYCKKCQQYFTEELDFIETGRRFTRRYEEYIYERVIASSVEQVKREEDLSWHQVNGIHQQVYERKKK
ncbi:helix-turn-helix domain-containing protein [Geitlerinema sp. CS-897]|nr:helix-turn-helix domain-containing protein [Geitlerinema sp. CS-897]